MLKYFLNWKCRSIISCACLWHNLIKIYSISFQILNCKAIFQNCLQLFREMLHNLSPPHLSCCFPLFPASGPPLHILPPLLCPYLSLFTPPIWSLLCPFQFRPFIVLPPCLVVGGQVQGRSRESSQTQLWGNSAGPAAVLQTQAAQETVLPAGSKY